jgi:hypothetical protein
MPVIFLLNTGFFWKWEEWKFGRFCRFRGFGGFSRVGVAAFDYA